MLSQSLSRALSLGLIYSWCVHHTHSAIAVADDVPFAMLYSAQYCTVSYVFLSQGQALA
jgi:hypothetical protein